MLKNKNGWFLQTWELYPLLGLKPGAHLPPEGFPQREIQGVQFKCNPAGNGGRRGPHRVFYLCEDCDRWVPFGRAGQHRKGREHKLNQIVKTVRVGIEG